VRSATELICPAGSGRARRHLARLEARGGTAGAPVEARVRRIVAAVRRMKADGWWWHEPTLTNRSIQSQIAREMAVAFTRFR